MDIIKFGSLVDSYLKFVLRDLKGKNIYCYPQEYFIRISIDFQVGKEFKQISRCVEYTEDINVFDSEMLTIANQIKECIDYERNGKIL